MSSPMNRVGGETARSLLGAGKFPQSLTKTMWFNWLPLACVWATEINHITASHIARELRQHKNPN
jgi:hypothetical protein